MEFTKLCIPKHIKKVIEDNISADMPVCTRFPPENSGYMHIGHLFACRLNQTVANVYNGKFLVRFDDTNPMVESDEYTNAILEDLADCGFDLTNLSYTSDSFQLILDKATELVESGHAYVDSSTQEEMAKQRTDLVGSPDRTLSVSENLIRWAGMIGGSASFKHMCLRLIGFPDSKNGALRDPVLFRSLDVPHHRTGDKFKVYPTYDLACAVLDSHDGVTHIFRSKEYSERDDQMKLILSKLNMRIPRAITYGRINIEGSIISKREIKKGIQEGLYSGWNDKKLFTYRGLKARGISLEGLNKFLDDIGFPEGSIKVQQQKIFTINTKIIDKNTYRLIAIEESDIEPITINLENDFVKEIPNFTGNVGLGKRDVVIGKDMWISAKEKAEFGTLEEMTIIYIGNAIFNGTSLQTHFEGDPKKTSKKILWLNPNNCVKIELEMLDNSIRTVYVESYFTNLKAGDYVQLNKVGYFYKKIVDGKEILVQVQV